MKSNKPIHLRAEHRKKAFRLKKEEQHFCEPSRQSEYCLLWTEMGC